VNTLRTRNSLAVVAATVALVGLAAGCSSTKQEAPTTTPTTTTPTATTVMPQPTVEPSENDLNPSGPNKFTPTHVVTPAPPTGGEGEHIQ
jgi:hypothetical protein